MREKIFERTSDGLRDALMCEMEDVRAGIASPAEAQAFALLAGKVIHSMEADIAMGLRQDAREREQYRRQQKALEQEREREVLLLESQGA